MTKQTAAGEPSMDEILASIRKIIADDGSKDAAPPAPPAPAQPRPRPAGPADGASSLSARLNGSFPAANGANAAAGAPLRLRASVRSAVDDDLGDILADNPRPFDPAGDSARRPRPVDFGTVAAGAPALGPAVATPLKSSAAEPVRAAPVVIAAAPVRSKNEAPAVAATLDGAPAPDAASTPPSAAAAPAFIPSALTPSVNATLPPSSGPMVLAAMPERPGVTSPAPSPAPAATPASTPEAPAPAAAKPNDDATAAAVASAIGALAAGLAAAVRPSSPEIVVSAAELAVSVPARAGSTAPSETSTALTSTPFPSMQSTSGSATPAARSVFTEPNAFVEGVALTPVKTLDDTAAELLRPMLRQWLDSNMPRIVEKALRIELAGQPELTDKP